ncbi:hypothetical protein ATCC90586_008426 [Pythium insidiosum]|nr:hypothetical protein ATCC90586_008426 [Pythium insidiosum]
MTVYQRQQQQQQQQRQQQQQQQQQCSSIVTAHDLDVLRRHHQFLRDEDEDAERGARDWEIRMSVRYYRRLFREYALADLSRYRDGQIGLRWRTEMEVVAGKGQFSCGNKRCDETRGLHSYELLFAYVEQAQKKRCLVKVRVCEPCARKLFYRKLKEKERSTRKRRREGDEEDDATRSRAASTSRRRRERGDDNSESRDSTRSIHEVCARLNADETARHRQPRDDKREDSDDAISELLL